MSEITNFTNDIYGNKKVLVVEDNPLNMKLFHDLLEAHGCTVIEVRDGLIAEQIAREETPDLIIMDIQLPQISGIDIITNIKNDENLRHIPVLAVTAFAMEEDEEKILAAGCEGYLAKPIKIDIFIDTVKKYI